MAWEAVININDDYKEYDPDGWNPYPEVILPNKDFKLHYVTHWLVQNEAGQMRSMCFIHDYRPDGWYMDWKHPEFGVIAFRKLPEAFEKE